MRWAPRRTLRLALLGAALCLACLQAAAQATEPLLIGAEDDWAPFSSVQDGKPVGMAVDIVSALFAEAGVAVQLVPMPYERCMQETLVGHLQGCFDTAPDAKLRRDYLFHSHPLFSDTALIVVRQNSPDSALQLHDLEGRSVITTSGYTYGEAFEGNRKIARVAAIGDINTLRMLKSGAADQAIVYRRILAYLLKTKGRDLQGSFKSVGSLSVNDLYISFSRRLPHAKELLKKLDAAHRRLIQSRAIAAIEQHWE